MANTVLYCGFLYISFAILLMCAWCVLVCFWSTTASDPDFASTYRQYLCAARILCSQPPDTYWLRRRSANTRHCHRQIVLCSTTSDLECSALSSTTDTNPYFGCQQGRLLLFRAGLCRRSSTGLAAVHPQCFRPTRVLSQVLRTYHPTSPWPSLAAGPGTDSIPSLCSGIPMSQWTSAAISRRSLDTESTKTLVHAFIASHVDYCNTVLAGSPRFITDRLQHVLNAAARVITGMRKFHRGLSDLLHSELHPSLYWTRW